MRHRIIPVLMLPILFAVIPVIMHPIIPVVMHPIIPVIMHPIIPVVMHPIIPVIVATRGDRRPFPVEVPEEGIFILEVLKKNVTAQGEGRTHTVVVKETDLPNIVTTTHMLVIEGPNAQRNDDRAHLLHLLTGLGPRTRREDSTPSTRVVGRHEQVGVIKKTTNLPQQHAHGVKPVARHEQVVWKRGMKGDHRIAITMVRKVSGLQHVGYPPVGYHPVWC